MHIDWAALGRVAGVSFAFGVGVVVVFSLGLVTLSENAPPEAGERAAVRAASGPRRAVAALCFLCCAAAVLFGLWLIVPQFHN